MKDTPGGDKVDCNPVVKHLEGSLQGYDLSTFNGLKLDGQMSWVYRPMWGRKRPTQLARAALSYLRAEIPIQVPLGDYDLKGLMTNLAEGWELPPSPKPDDRFMSKKWVREHVRFKPNPASITKANIFLHDLATDVAREMSVFYCQLTPHLDALLRGGAKNDQLCAYVLYAAALRPLSPVAAQFARRMVAEPEVGKELSNFIKAVGSNSTRLGSMLVETQALQGRGVGGANPQVEARLRCDPSWVHGKVANYPPSQLESAIRRVLSLELTRDGKGGFSVDFPSLEDHWNARWRWGVNGSHNQLVDVKQGRTLPDIPNIKRWHRRAALENYETDPRVGWDGTTYVSTSPKEEHGKTRAIYACDTVNYLAFQHLMEGVESSWRGVRVVLDPGKGGTVGMAKRVSACRSRSGVSMMLDYDDFNSHHSTEAMVMLIRITAEMTGYDPALARVLEQSFHRTEIRSGGALMGTCAGTLMSGHRCTTYINSVLNMAYLMCTLGEEFLMECSSIHVGDDVYLGVGSYSQAADVAQKVAASPLRMNRSKQSVGHVSTEFLRMASTGNVVQGYVTRTIAGLVSGNWVTTRALQPMEALNTMMTGARALANRARSETLPLLLESSVRRAFSRDCLNDKVLRELLLGSVAINDGPQFVSGGFHRWVSVSEDLPQIAEDSVSLPTCATTQYLTYAASELESSTLMAAGVTVKDKMVDASYTKSLDFSRTTPSRIVFSRVKSRPAVGSTSVEELLTSKRVRGGVLLKYPLLLLAKNQLPELILREAVGRAGGDARARDLDFEAWGAQPHGVIVDGHLSYTDASSFGKLSRCSVLTCSTKFYV